MQTVKLEVKTEGHQCNGDCMFLFDAIGVTKCVLFDSDIQSDELYGGVKRYHRCSKCIQTVK